MNVKISINSSGVELELVPHVQLPWFPDMEGWSFGFAHAWPFSKHLEKLLHYCRC